MGIHGLRTFVSRNHDRLEEERHLYGTKLVIDGNNLIYDLYYSAGLECAYGGDYDRYAMEIRHYFGLFKACSVEAIVVFDGGHDVSDRKLETRLQSMRDRLSTASEVARTGEPKKILPCLANAVFKEVIRQLGVRMLQCRFEADEEIAAIANHFGCPVASQDSDFYIFDVAGGFIRLDSIAKAPSTTSIGGVQVKSLFCQLYHVRNLLILFPGLDPELLPLFPSVLGNDYVSRSTFDAFLSGLKPPEVCESKSRGGQQQTNIINLLHWMQTVISREDAISQVLATVKSEDRDRKEKLLRASAASYAAFTSGFVSSFERGSRLELLDSSGAPYPRWFAELFFSCEITSYLLNVAAARKVFHYSQIECSTMPSSYACSLPLRKVLFGLALGPEEGSDVTIEVFERDGEDLTRRLVRPSYEVPRFGKLPKIEDIVGLGISKRRELFDRVLQFDGSKLEYPRSLHTLLAITAYWVKHTSAQINENLLRSLLLGMVLFRLRLRPCSLPNQVSHEPKSETGNIQEVLLGIQDEDLTEVPVEEILQNFSKFFSRFVGGHARNFDADVVYAYCQLQTCMYAASCLLKTLLRPYQDVFHESLNGTFLHNFTRELDAQRNPDLFISRKLVEGSPLERAFSRFYKNFRRGLSDHYFGLKSRSTRKTSGVRTRMSDRGPAAMSANRFADLADLAT